MWLWCFSLIIALSHKAGAETSRETWEARVYPSDRSMGVFPREDSTTRWRQRGGGYKIVKEQFSWMGDTYVRKDGFLSEETSFSLLEFHKRGTIHLQKMSCALRVIHQVVLDRGGFFQEFWPISNRFLNEEIKAGLQYCSDLGSSEYQARAIDIWMSDLILQEISSSFALHVGRHGEIPRTSNPAPSKARAAITLLIGDTAHMLSVLSSLEQVYDFRISTQVKLPHPKYLEIVDFESRIDSLESLLSFCAQATKWQFDTATPSRLALFRQVAKLREVSRKLQTRYRAIVSQYPDRHLDLMDRPRASRHDPLRPSRKDVNAALKLKTTMRDMQKKISMVGNPRPDGIPGNVRFLRRTHPHVLITLKVNERKVLSLTVGQVSGAESSRIGPATLAKFGMLERLLKEKLEEGYGRLMYALADDTWQALLGSPNGATFTARLKTELVCFWQRDKMAPRMLELMYFHVPGITSSSKDPHLPSDSAQWLLIDITFDSQTEETSTSRALNLVREYADEYAEHHGIIRELPGHFVDLGVEGTCPITPLYTKAGTYMSGAEGSRSFVDVCIKYPEWFSDKVPSFHIYPACLNLFPMGTQVFTKGRLVPFVKPKPPVLPRAFEQMATPKEKKNNQAPPLVFLQDAQRQWFHVEDISVPKPATSTAPPPEIKGKEEDADQLEGAPEPRKRIEPDDSDMDDADIDHPLMPKKGLPHLAKGLPLPAKGLPLPAKQEYESRKPTSSERAAVAFFRSVCAINPSEINPRQFTEMTPVTPSAYDECVESAKPRLP